MLYHFDLSDLTELEIMMLSEPLYPDTGPTYASRHSQRQLSTAVSHWADISQGVSNINSNDGEWPLEYPEPYLFEGTWKPIPT